MNDTTTTEKYKYYTPKTVQEWRERIPDECKGDRGRFRFLAREVFSSRAYCDLDPIEQLVLNTYLNKLTYESPNKRRLNRKSRLDKEAINRNELVVTNPELKARCKPRGKKSEGISDRKISMSRKRLVAIGFLDVVTPGKWPQPGVYAFSERWREYPCGNYLRDDCKPVAFAPYKTNLDRYNARRGLKCVK